jgi:hypothetical protein
MTDQQVTGVGGDAVDADMENGDGLVAILRRCGGPGCAESRRASPASPQARPDTPRRSSPAVMDRKASIERMAVHHAGRRAAE